MNGCNFLLSLVVSLVISLVALPAHAVEIAVAEGLILEISLSEGWTLHLEPPEALVKEAASHVAHEAAAANATAEQIEAVVRRRLGVNEAFIYHAASGAHLDIDFSPVGPGQSTPSAQTLRNSAEYAARSLENEDDVAALAWEVSSAKIAGVDDVFLLSADYLQHDHQTNFRGYIGSVDKNWFYLYFTAPGKNPEVLQEMQSMLDSLLIRAADR